MPTGNLKARRSTSCSREITLSSFLRYMEASVHVLEKYDQAIGDVIRAAGIWGLIASRVRGNWRLSSYTTSSTCCCEILSGSRGVRSPLGVRVPLWGVARPSKGLPRPCMGETTPLGGTGIFKSSGEAGMISSGRSGIWIRRASF